MRSSSSETPAATSYDLGKKGATIFSADESYAGSWLPDNRRIVYFTNSGHDLVVLDTVTRTRTVVDVRLPGPSTNEVFTISPDGRTIY